MTKLKRGTLGLLCAIALGLGRDAMAASAAVDILGKVPPYFVENGGRLDPEVGLTLAGRDATAYFTPRGVTFSLAGSGQGRTRSVVAVDMLGARRAVRPEGADPQRTVVSQFRGPRSDWRTGLRTYGSVTYREVWPGIDLTWGGREQLLESTMTVAPGADPLRIQLRYRGATSVRVDSDAGLRVESGSATLREERPYAYQDIDGQRREVPVSLRVRRRDDDYVASFDLGRYDRTRPLVIDPVVVVYCGFIGGEYEDNGKGIAVGPDGGAYVVGYTDSTETTFPVRVGPDIVYGPFDSQRIEAYVAKVRPDGTGLEYCGYIGGDMSDHGIGVAVDAAGSAYVTGYTSSSEATFPVVAGPMLVAPNGDNAFVAKVTPDGSSLAYCGYIGGEGFDQGTAIAVDAQGRAYVVGSTASGTGFPLLGGPGLAMHGGDDAFIARVRADGTGFEYCGIIGGALDDIATGVAVDASGAAYVTGWTRSAEDTFPVVVGPRLNYDAEDAFVAKVRPDGSGLQYCGYLGGHQAEIARGIAVDAAGAAYVVGRTWSSEATFPVAVGPKLTFAGPSDGFVGKVSPAGDRVEWLGYIGEPGDDDLWGVALDPPGNVVVAGSSPSNKVVNRVRADGTGLLDAVALNLPNLTGLAVDGAGAAYLVGWATGPSGIPLTVGPDLTHNSPGHWDTWVAKVAWLDCASNLSSVRRLVATKWDQFGPGDVVHLSWQADPGANAYNVWYVTAKEDVPRANLANRAPAGPAQAVTGCAPTPGTWPGCDDWVAITRDPAHPFYYQVKSFCDAATEGP